MRKAWVGQRAVLLLAAVVVGACSEVTDPNGAPRAREGAHSAAQSAASDNQRPQDAAFVAMSQSVPSFSGYYYDRGDLVVALTDTTKASSVLALISRSGTGADGTAHPQGRRTGRTRVVQAQYTFAELSQWRDQLFGDVMEMDQVEYLDLDEEANRVVVGVNDSTATSAVLRLAAGYRIPLAAVTVETTEPVRQLASLADRVRPVRGALGIFLADGSSCTLGMVAGDLNQIGFFTNSHCTDQFWGADVTPLYQATPLLAADSIGREVRDPAPFACGWRNKKKCRYSDAAFIGKMTLDRRFGEIARTTFFTDNNSDFGSTVIDLGNPFFAITSTTSGVVKGDALDKVGKTTGWTTGEVFKTCKDLKSGGGLVSEFRVLCQDELKLLSFFGDSGSPVFVFGGSTVQLHGMMWGGRFTTLHGMLTYVSPLINMMADFGILAVD
jgi:hypothetical protein